eukprot:g14589.t1
MNVSVTVTDEPVAVGRFVRIRRGVRPLRGFGGVSGEEIGLCLNVKARLATACFEKQNTWRAFVDELEVVKVPKIVCLRDLNLSETRIPRGTSAGILKRAVCRHARGRTSTREVFETEAELTELYAAAKRELNWEPPSTTPQTTNNTGMKRPLPPGCFYELTLMVVDSLENPAVAEQGVSLDGVAFAMDEQEEGRLKDQSRSARGARLRYLLRYDPVRWCREFSVAPDDASSAGELSSKARFPETSSEALDQVRSEFSQRFYFTLERAAKALIQTFDVPRYQRSAVKRLLQKRWTFPLGENELLKSGQLQKEEICYFKDGDIPDTAWEALLDAVGRVHDLPDPKILLLQQHLLSSDERITERESLAAELRKTPLKVLGRMEDKYAVELEVLRDSALGDLIQRVLDEINVEGAMNPNANEERLTAVFLVPGSFLETTKGLARAEKPDGSKVAIRVVGAGGAGLPCNGDYVEVTEGPLHNYRDHPVYKNRLTGAVIFWAGFWKMNYTSQTSGWYYAHEHSHNLPLPPEGQWSNYGYNGRRATPSPFVSRGNVDFPALPGKLRAGERCVLAMGSSGDVLSLSPVLSARSVGEVMEVRASDGKLLVRNLQTGQAGWHAETAVERLEGMWREEMVARNLVGAINESFLAWAIHEFTTFVGYSMETSMISNNFNKLLIILVYIE